MQYTIGPQFQWEKVNWRDPQSLTSAPASVDTMCGPVFNKAPINFAPMDGPQGDASSGGYNGSCPTGLRTSVNSAGEIMCNGPYGTSQSASSLKPLFDGMYGVADSGFLAYVKAQLPTLQADAYSQSSAAEIRSVVGPRHNGAFQASGNWYHTFGEGVHCLSLAQVTKLVDHYTGINGRNKDHSFIVTLRQSKNAMSSYTAQMGTYGNQPYANRNSPPQGVRNTHSRNYQHMFR